MDTPFEETPLIGVSTPLRETKNTKWFISEEGSVIIEVSGKTLPPNGQIILTREEVCLLNGAIAQYYITVEEDPL